MATTTELDVQIRLLSSQELSARLLNLEAYTRRNLPLVLSRSPTWLAVLAEGLGHTPYCLEAARGQELSGLLPLASVRSLLFGHFLVSLPYLNTGGVLAEDPAVAAALIDRAVALADELGVRYLELRHEEPLEHPALSARRTEKVHMRLPLPGRASQLWDRLNAKVRNQVRKGRKNGLQVTWGGQELLPDFYDVFSRNMCDLGTPVYGRALFDRVLYHFPDRADFCVVRSQGRAAAAALLLHGWGLTEVPSASSLARSNSSCANMLLYWHLLERWIQRGQGVFDFGRSSMGSNTFRFKKQWGAEPHPATWQYYVRQGRIDAMRPDNPRYQRMIQLWQRLPIGLTRLIGPRIVRGIP